MTKKRSTRRALALSCISLLLCVSMFVGTTFAWFTDSVSSVNNVITAGNLDVELEYWNGTEWEAVNSETNVFEKGTLWEPGHTEVVYLKVSNLGTLALKYQLGVNVASETAGINVDEKTFKLSDYIEFGVVETATENFYADRDAARVAVKNAKVLNKGYSKSSTLLPAEENKESAEYVALVVYMPETVGNEANYRGDAVPTINLGINLVATQLTYEKDSFDDQYDKDASFPQITYYINNPEEFKETLDLLSAATDVSSALIVLNTDVEWETGSGHGSTPLIGENSSAEVVMINGNGNTLTATGNGVGSIRAANGGTLVFDNIIIEDESVSYAEGSWEFTYLEFAGNLKFNDVTFNSGIQIDSDNGTSPEAEAIFTNCTFYAGEASVYGAWIGGGNVSFENCYFTGTRGLKVHECYGSNITSVVVDGCTFRSISKKPGVVIGDIHQSGETGTYGSASWTDTSDTTVTIKNNTFVNCQPGDQGHFIYESDTAVGSWLVLENNEVKTDVALSTIKNAFNDANGNDISENIGNVVFGKTSEYPDVVANNTPISNENGVAVYQVANGANFDVYYLSESKIVLPENCYMMFYEMTALTTFDASNLDMSQVTNAKCMFTNCSNLTTIKGAEDWDMSNVTNMQSLFYGCNKLDGLDVSKWDTSNVTNMRMVFFRCYDLSDESLKGVKNWDVSNVTNFHSMFKHAYGVTTLDLSKWDTSNATNMTHMFANIGNNLTELNLSSFDTSKVTDMSWMFYSANKLTTIYVGDGWTTAALDPANPTCFYNNQALVGGNGTTWLDVCDMANPARPWESSAKLDYAIVDGGTSNPGLLTYKSN